MNDELHRDDGPAVEFANGSKYWYLNGVLHRVDGPANEFANGTKYWYLNGLRHRVDGPANEFANGENEWWLYSKRLVPSESFSSMEAWILYLNDNEEQTYQVIHDIKGIIGFIKNPSDKQTRVHQMSHLL